MKKWMKKTIAMVLAFSLFIDPALFPKAAYAWDEYDSSVCKQIDSDKASGDPEKSPPQDAYNECQNAQLAHKVYGAAIAKSIIFGVAGAVCAAAAYFEWAGSSTICQGIDAGAMAFDLIMSQVFKRDAESTVGKVASFINMAEGIAVFKLGSNVISSLSGTASAGASSSGQGECIASAIALFLLMGLAIWDTIEAQSLASKHLANAKSMKEAYDLRNRVNTTYGGTTGNTVNPGSAPGSSGTTDGGSASDPCVGKTGNDYLKCLGQEAHDPQLSAIADNPGLDKLLSPVLGKSLGDFVKGYNGNGSADSIKDYVANGIGLSADGKKLMDKIQKTVMDDLGEKYAHSGYKSSPKAAVASKKEETDFNKIMGDLLKQLSPEDAKETKALKGNPADAVYRKLDLLSADKIESNKDISLFVRVGYRYQKKGPVLNSAVK